MQLNNNKRLSLEGCPMTIAGSDHQDSTVMLVTRGRGWGHAVPNMAIARKLCTLIPDPRLRFVSYAVGSEATL